MVIIHTSVTDPCPCAPSCWMTFDTVLVVAFVLPVLAAAAVRFCVNNTYYIP